MPRPPTSGPWPSCARRRSGSRACCAVVPPARVVPPSPARPGECCRGPSATRACRRPTATASTRSTATGACTTARTGPPPAVPRSTRPPTAASPPPTTARSTATNRLVLDHGILSGVGVASIYNHATKYVVRTGERVKRGQVIGYVGSTGWSTGCHLHFTVMVNGRTVDPRKWL
ncbi:M23 family metallopeptidase [Nocardioides daphniae]|uniref:M23 family metallopeptidase n=1 Tax=Nocardioides daphniae TaxID=402297 RepID=A0A4P7UK35_9ACTN|nr:M23 family metallopeptidase [Nocardioides daphniae]